MPSGLTAVLVAVSPFWLTGFDAMLGGERLSSRRLLGLVVGFLGIVALLFGGVALFLAATVHGELGHLAFTPRTAAALAYLILFGAVVGFTAYAYALKYLPVATMSLSAYVNPVIAVLLGTVLLHEPFGVRMLAGASMVLAGIALVRARSG